MTTCATTEDLDELKKDTAEVFEEIDCRLKVVEDYINCKQTSFKFGIVVNAPTTALNPAKDLIAAQMTALGVENVFYIGNLGPLATYAADIDNALLPYQYWIDKQALFPVMAENELENALGQTLLDKLTYTPSNGSNKRYYSKTFDDGKISFFVLNSGYDNTGPPAVIEPDGNAVDSTQYNWYRNELLNSCSSQQYKRFVLFKTPFVTGADSGTAEPPKLAASEMDWAFENDKVHVFAGGQIDEIHRRGDMKITSICHATTSTVDLADALTGSNLGLTEEYKGAPGASGVPTWIFLDVRETLTLMQLVRASDGTVLHSTIL